MKTLARGKKVAREQKQKSVENEEEKYVVGYQAHSQAHSHTHTEGFAYEKLGFCWFAARMRDQNKKDEWRE